MRSHPLIGTPLIGTKEAKDTIKLLIHSDQKNMGVVAIN